MTNASWWFRHQVRALLRRLRDPRWDLVLAVSPDREGMQSRVWPSDLARVPQGAGDLGDRMAFQMRYAAPRPVLVIGADIPGVTRAHISGALRKLGEADAVIGPSTDGGYWLIGWRGARPLPREIFKSVRWSTRHAMSDTLATLKSFRVAMASTLADVDGVEDLPRGRF